MKDKLSIKVGQALLEMANQHGWNVQTFRVVEKKDSVFMEINVSELS